jgi:hypothetical protein
MSHIQSKIARRAVRAIGKHPRDVQTVLTKPTRIWATITPGVGPSAIFLGQRTLAADCGRAVYRTLKKAGRKGMVPAAA